MWPLPYIDDSLDSLGNSKNFSKCDLSSGFFPDPIHPDAIKMSALSTLRGPLKVLKISRGHAGTPSSLVCLIACKLADLGSIYTYLDDVIVLDATPSSHVDSIKAFLSRLAKHSLNLSAEESRVATMTIDFQGHALLSSGLRPDAKKLKALAKNFKPAECSSSII